MAASAEYIPQQAIELLRARTVSLPLLAQIRLLPQIAVAEKDARAEAAPPPSFSQGVEVIDHLSANAKWGVPPP